jgi:molybdate/tungstate transport system substrate-binding protein
MNPHSRSLRRVWSASAICLALTACAGGRDGDNGPSAATRDTLVVFVAASLAKPMQPLLDMFAARARGGSAVVQRESGGSLEHARKLTELHRIPDVIILADEEVFPQLLVPRQTSWYVDFARNRMVVAYTLRSRHATEIDSTNWTRILARQDVQVGRSDPDIAPVGYRTILMLRLAARRAGDAALTDRLLANAPRRNMRSNAAELAALLRAGELDYIYEYESVAIANGFRFVQLAPEIDLGDVRYASSYASETLRVRGAKLGDSTVVSGRPILYAMSVPRTAPHPAAATRFVSLLLSDEGRRMLRTQHVDMLDTPRFFGDSVPTAIRDIGRP